MKINKKSYIYIYIYNLYIVYIFQYFYIYRNEVLKKKKKKKKKKTYILHFPSSLATANIVPLGSKDNLLAELGP